MAKADFNFPLGRNPGSYSVYKMRGVERLIIRAKAGPSKKQIATAPQFAFMRQNMSEFGGAGKISGLLLDACYGIKHLADANFTGNLSKACRLIMEKDSSVAGSHSILLSKYGNLLEGFSMNKENQFDSVVKQSPTVTFSRVSCKASLEFPVLYPGVNLFGHWQLPYYRFIIVMGLVPDMISTLKGYTAVNPLMTFNPVQVRTDWFSAAEEIGSVIREIELATGTLIDASGSLVVSIGIEFGRNLSNRIIEAVRFAGCGKILAVG